MPTTNNDLPNLASDDPLQPLIMEGLRSLILERSGPITWEVGDTWVVYDGGEWRIGADEWATQDQVRELIVATGGVVKLRDYA